MGGVNSFWLSLVLIHTDGEMDVRDSFLSFFEEPLLNTLSGEESTCPDEAGDAREEG